MNDHTPAVARVLAYGFSNYRYRYPPGKARDCFSAFGRIEKLR
jgi:hypothetical protein